MGGEKNYHREVLLGEVNATETVLQKERGNHREVLPLQRSSRKRQQDHREVLRGVGGRIERSSEGPFNTTEKFSPGRQ